MHKTQKAVLWFDEVTKEDVPIVDGKGTNLGEITNAHTPIPPSLIITSSVYYQFLHTGR